MGIALRSNPKTAKNSAQASARITSSSIPCGDFQGRVQHRHRLRRKGPSLACQTVRQLTLQAMSCAALAPQPMRPSQVCRTDRELALQVMMRAARTLQPMLKTIRPRPKPAYPDPARAAPCSSSAIRTDSSLVISTASGSPAGAWRPIGSRERRRRWRPTLPSCRSCCLISSLRNAPHDDAILRTDIGPAANSEPRDQVGCRRRSSSRAHRCPYRKLKAADDRLRIG